MPARERPPEATAWLTVARIAKTQGRRGEVAAEILTDFPERLASRREVWLWDGAEVRRPAWVERSWFHKNYLVCQIEGVSSITQAEALVGLEVQIPRRDAVPLPAGMFYEADLVGCRVVEKGRELGRVRELVPTGGVPLLAVESPDGKELLIPFAEEFCRRLAPQEKLIEAELPDELRDLN